ncbi:transcriptional regulator [Saccharibacillus sp. O23]|uniref:winged helix-turn-helix transcriptional regulator n=1 Tax=Saccharibacillus sp. O23 TaxID=2009338 RepID=UPI000B4E266B|nr:helix-turn-helix domain-containing protein [Saccharibacillus sp. O23]OWR32556.1 transcriptional regulator [Saccharibacillus sp. O23]
MQYKENLQQLCPATFAFGVIGGKWNLPILSMLSNQPVVRYNELKRGLDGITGTMLTNCLKELIDYGIVHREQYPEIPLRVEYSLTPSGQALVPLISSIVDWGEQHIESLIAADSSSVSPRPL